MSIQDEARDFIQQAEQTQQGLVRELWSWFRYNKKWWLTPVVVLLLAVGALLILSSTAVAPFIYTLF